MLRKYKCAIRFSMTFVLLFLLSSFAFVSAAHTNEHESNNNYNTANITYDDYDNYGALYSNTGTDLVDYWKIRFVEDGVANFWLGSIPSDCDYDLTLYDSNGTTVLAHSLHSGNTQELISRYPVVKDKYYYIRINSHYGTSPNNYHMRAKFYAEFGGKLIGGIYNRKYYLGFTSTATAYINASKNAILDWNYAVNANNNGVGTDFYFTQSSTIPGSSIRFWGEYHPDVDWQGLTMMYDSSGTYIDEDGIITNDWSIVDIIFNTDSAPTTQSSEMKKIAGHEIGHAIGLAHVNDHGRLMHPNWDLCTAYSPTQAEVALANHLY